MSDDIEPVTTAKQLLEKIYRMVSPYLEHCNLTDEIQDLLLNIRDACLKGIKDE